MPATRVLIVGPRGHRATGLLDQLARWGCSLFFAEDCKSALSMLKAKPFDLILSQLMLTDGAADQFLRPLEGSRAEMFFSSAVEDGAAWLRVLVNGKDHWSKPTLFGPEQFIAYLDKTLFQAKLAEIEEGQSSGKHLAQRNNGF